MNQPDASYTPIDVGFDLRQHPDIALQLPAGENLRVRYCKDTEELEVVGSPDTVARVLRAAGYSVVYNG